MTGTRMMNPNSNSSPPSSFSYGDEFFSQFAFTGSSSSPRFGLARSKCPEELTQKSRIDAPVSTVDHQKKKLPGYEIPIFCIEDLEDNRIPTPRVEEDVQNAKSDAKKPRRVLQKRIVSRYFENKRSRVGEKRGKSHPGKGRMGKASGCVENSERNEQEMNSLCSKASGSLNECAESDAINPPRVQQQRIVSRYFQKEDHQRSKRSRVGEKRGIENSETNEQGEANEECAKCVQNAKSDAKKPRQRIVSRYFERNEQASCGKCVKGRRKTTLSRAEMYSEAYRRKLWEDTWKPPPSGIRLLQHDHAFDPWRVLVICMLLNRTTGNQAKQVIPKLFTLCPNPKAALEVSKEQIEDIIRPLGLQRKRSQTIQHLSEMYLKDTWTHVTQLPGVGKYGADAHAIFCTGYWTQLQPNDYMLNYYWEFLHTIRHLL